MYRPLQWLRVSASGLKGVYTPIHCTLNSSYPPAPLRGQNDLQTGVKTRPSLAVGHKHSTVSQKLTPNYQVALLLQKASHGDANVDRRHKLYIERTVNHINTYSTSPYKTIHPH